MQNVKRYSVHAPAATPDSIAEQNLESEWFSFLEYATVTCFRPQNFEAMEAAVKILCLMCKSHDIGRTLGFSSHKSFSKLASDLKACIASVKTFLELIKEATEGAGDANDEFSDLVDIEVHHNLSIFEGKLTKAVMLEDVESSDAVFEMDGVLKRFTTRDEDKAEDIQGRESEEGEKTPAPRARRGGLLATTKVAPLCTGDSSWKMDVTRVVSAHVLKNLKDGGDEKVKMEKKLKKLMQILGIPTMQRKFRSKLSLSFKQRSSANDAVNN